MLKKDPPRKKDVIDLSDNALKKNYINLDDDGPGSEHLGTLIVVLLKAKNLNDKHFRKQDVYAQATLNGTKKKTKADVRAGQHPVWDQEVRFPIVKSKKARNRKLEVACYAQEPHPLPDQLLGKAVVDLTEILKTGEFDEWVELDVDGVQRGEMYLEMTYYSNDPEPEKPSQPAAAAAPKNKILSNFLEIDSAKLQRRPSKLPPTDRLSRPRQTSVSLASGQTPVDPQPPGAFPQTSYSPPVQQQPLPSQGGRLPASLTPSYGPPPQNRWEPLPHQSSPEHHEPPSLPAFLRPGGGRTPPSSSPIPIPQLLPPASYGNHRRPSPAPPSQSPYPGPQFGGSPPIPVHMNPYFGSAPSPAPPPGPVQNPHLLAQASPQSYSGPSALWRQESYSTAAALDSGIQGAGGFSIPISVNGDPLGGMYAPSPQIGYGRDSRPTHVRAGSDPILLARYSTPLPLPPGAAPRMQPVAPAPAPQIPPSIVPPALPSKENKPSGDRTRFETLRRAEDDAKRRLEQEIRDLELARQLDRELNLS